MEHLQKLTKSSEPDSYFISHKYPKVKSLHFYSGYRLLLLSPCLFNFYAEYIMRNAGLEEAQAGVKIARRNINNLRYADDTTFMAESEEE